MLCNTEIETLFTGFKVNGESIDVAYLFYGGHSDKYVVYNQYDTISSLAGDDNIIGVWAVYDFDIYSKGNYTAIAQALKQKLTGAGWVWQPDRDSQDFFDVDTGYYHKTFCYAKPVQFE